MIKRCQDVGLMQEKKPLGADPKHVRRAQSPKQCALQEAKHNNHIFEKKIRTRCPGNEQYQEISKETDRHPTFLRNSSLINHNGEKI